MTTQDTTAATAAARPLDRTSRKKNRTLVRFVPVVFAAVLIAAVFSGLWSSANGSDGAAPKQLASLSLSQVITGPDAVAQMSKLHGKGVGVVDGYIAHYQGASGGAVLYVGQMGSVESATTLSKQMEERIAAGNQYFTGLKPLVVEGTTVFTVRSGKETHYFWQAGPLINWIGFDRDDPAALAEAVKTVR